MDGKGWSCPRKRAGDRGRDGGWKTRLVRGAGCRECGVPGLFPAGKRKREPEEERMVGDTKRKTGGTWVPTNLFFSLLRVHIYRYVFINNKIKKSLSAFFFLIWHVVSLTDSRPGDRAGWLVLCGSSGGGHSSAVSALTEIPTP